MNRFAMAAVLATVVVMMFQACSPKAQDSCNYVQNADLQRVSWKGVAPVKLYVHSSVPQEFHQCIRNAVLTVNSTLRRPLIEIQSFIANDDGIPKKDGFSVIYWMNSWEPDKMKEQARTTIYWSGAQITEADIRVNDFKYDFYTGDTAVSGRVHCDSLILHELGHVLGLKHVKDTMSVMNESLPEAPYPNHNRMTPFPVDVSSLRCEY